MHMTNPFLPRPSPDHHDPFECDSDGHLRGQDVRLLIHHADQGGRSREGSAYISTQGAKEKGQQSGPLISNHHSSHLRAANPRPVPSYVSCFISSTIAPLTIGHISPLFMSFIVLMTHSLLLKGASISLLTSKAHSFHFYHLPSFSFLHFLSSTSNGHYLPTIIFVSL